MIVNYGITDRLGIGTPRAESRAESRGWDPEEAQATSHHRFFCEREKLDRRCRERDGGGCWLGRAGRGGRKMRKGQQAAALRPWSVRVISSCCLSCCVSDQSSAAKARQEGWAADGF